MNLPPAARIQTVTELTRSLKGLLESSLAFVAVHGEVSNLKAPYSGHLYFTLKDREAQLRAVLFKTQRRYLSVEPREGMQVVCRGRISVYEPRGEYQLLVDSLELTGSGERLAALEQLKERLRREGLFDETRKRRLPLLPAAIHLLTSPQGAAVHDFLAVAGRRFPSVPILIHPVPVQGIAAAPEIVQALATACQRGRTGEVIVISRGGGSLEDLWPFNDEALVRAVHRASLPVVSAVGHEIDFTLLDFVADRRAATPTAAAEAVLPDREELRRRIGQHRLRQRVILVHRLAGCRHRLEFQRWLLTDPRHRLERLRLRLDLLQTGLLQVMERHLLALRRQLETCRQALDHHAPQRLTVRPRETLARLRRRLAELVRLDLERRANRLVLETTRLRAASPQTVLKQGYAIVMTEPEGRVVRSRGETRPGQRLGIRWQDGVAVCVVADQDAQTEREGGR